MRSRHGWLCVVGLSTLLVSGCGVARQAAVDPVTGKTVVGITGRVHGGQQPVTQSTIQLYTVGTTGDGSAATPLLMQTVTTDVNGNFSITGLYSCTNATQVYLTATGGQPLVGVTNSNLAMMTALGSCTALQQAQFVMVNEVTTVAAVSALAPFMTGPMNVGSGTADAGDLATAFTLASAYADPSTGNSPGPNVPAGTVVPSAMIYALANTAAACINSGGTAATGTSGLCGQLFSLTTPTSGTIPSNTISALLNIQQNPAANVMSLFNLAGSTPPFAGASTAAPTNFAVKLSPLTGGTTSLSVTPSPAAFGNVAVGFTGSETLTVSNTGTLPVTISGYSVTGPNASDFSITTPSGYSSTTPCGYGPLAAGAQCTLQVNVVPSAMGARSAYLKLVSTAPDSPSYTTLFTSGTTASAGPITLSPATLPQFNLADTWQDITLTNSGSTPLHIRGVSLSDTTNFTLSAGTCVGTLAAGASCVSSVSSSYFTYQFSAPVTKIATVSFDTDATGGLKTYAVSSANQGYFQLSSSIAQTAVGSSGSFGILLTPSSLYNSVAVAGAMSGSSEFALTVTSCTASAFDYGGNGSCSIFGTYTPTANGSHTARFVRSNTSATPDNSGDYVSLVAAGTTGYQPLTLGSTSLTVTTIAGEPLTSPTNDAYGPVYGPNSVTVTNNGTTTLSLRAISRGSGEDQLIFNASGCASLAPAATCSVIVNMVDGPVLGSTTLTLTVSDTLSQASQTIPLTISRVADAMSLAPNGLTFYNGGTSGPTIPVLVGDLALMPLAHTYVASVPSGSYFAIANSTTCVGTTSSLCRFDLTLSGSAPTFAQDYITVTDQTAGLTKTLLLSEQTSSTPPAATPLAFSQQAVDFVRETAGTTSTPVTVTLTNISSTNQTVSSVAWVGGNGNAAGVHSFSTTDNCAGNTLTPGGTCMIQVIFASDPTDWWSVWGDFRITLSSGSTEDLFAYGFSL